MKSKYIQEVSHFSINLSKDEYHSYDEYIRQNTPLTPEIVGKLIGEAQPVLRDKVCPLCSKPILIKEVATAKEFGTDYTFRHNSFHRQCYIDAKEKEHV